MTGRTPLILLAGLLCDRTVWEDAAALLDDIADIRILSFPDMESIPAMAQAVLAEAPRQFALAGHSMGGRVALETYARAAGRIDRLALLNTGIHPRREGEAEARQRLVEIAFTEGMAALAAAWLPPMLKPGRMADTALVSRLNAMIERNTADGFAAQIRALLDRPDAAAVLPTVRVPLLLATGRQDSWSPLAQHQHMHRLAPHATLTVIEDAGHMAPCEQPEQVAAALRQWLAAES